MTAIKESALHCPVCGHDVLIISERGLACARCGKLVRAIPPSMRPRADKAAGRIAERWRSRTKSAN